MPLRVLLADDHQVVRQGVRAVLEREGFQVVGEASDGREAVRLAHANDPDLAVLDLSMPGLNGLDAGRQIIHDRGRTGVVLLTMHAEEYQILAALRAGIRGYVVKTQAGAELVHALREVAAGGTFLSPDVCGIMVGAYLAGNQVAADPLTAREREVLQLVAEGKTTKEVASVLSLTVKTAESYRGRLMEKLEIHGTAGLVRYAIRRGLIQA